MYSYAYAYLPASTASLLASSVLVFSTLFGYFIVKKKINDSVVNSIAIITAAMTIIALDSDSDRYAYITESQYIMGFVWIIMGSALHWLIFALVVSFCRITREKIFSCCLGATGHGFPICLCSPRLGSLSVGILKR
ncbi:unnamed protein product [Ilex paraguariensis]|uniref:Uncharacterized protein n=1 Tax=Ilex paraguariensis TaxID=185542 RepID=A0ABC8TMN1_9AQUA